MSFAVVVKKIRLELSQNIIFSLQGALFNSTTLDASWVEARDWAVCHTDGGEKISRFVATSVIRALQKIGVQSLYAVDTTDIFRAIDKPVTMRFVPLSLEGISQACFGPPDSAASTEPDFDWLLSQAWHPSIFFVNIDPLPMVILFDASTCITLTGPEKFVASIVAGSRRTWYEGIPLNGFSYGENRKIFLLSSSPSE